MAKVIEHLRQGDCIEGINSLPEGSVDLVFADPPFNIGYEYDVYVDSLDYTAYLKWSRKWLAAVHRVLKSDGTFWLAIGDEHAAELKLESQKLGFRCRSWVIWYYTFGVNCSHKFTRSHAHLFHFVKDPARFTFNSDRPENRIPSARQLVYGDSRANPKGRLPDDTWLIRPAGTAGEFKDKQLSGPLSPSSHPSTPGRPSCCGPRTWAFLSTRRRCGYFPRVAGTFKDARVSTAADARTAPGANHPLLLERRRPGPGPLLGEIHHNADCRQEVGRRYMGFDVSSDYIAYGMKRLESVCVEIRSMAPPNPCSTLRQRGQAKFESPRNPRPPFEPGGRGSSSDRRLVQRPSD